MGLSAGPARGPSQARPESAPYSGLTARDTGPDEETRWFIAAGQGWAVLEPE